MSSGRKRRWPGGALVGAGLVLLLAGCGTAGAGGPGPGAVPPDLPVAGTYWTIGAVTVDGQRSAAPDGARLAFGTDGQVHGDNGCNSFGATVAVRGDLLTVSPGGSTAKACPEDRGRFESAWTKAFTGPLRGTLKGQALTLTAPDGRNSLELKAEPSAPLRGTPWRIDGLVSGETASALPTDSGTKARLVIGADGRITGNLGCNNFSATARVEGGTLTVEGPAATTRMMCSSPQMRLETQLYALLDGPLAYRLDHRTLTLTTPEGKGFTATATATATAGEPGDEGGAGARQDP
ncbi:META domain-containing protein [Streptomyces sp. CBMA291]|nr:META domain-containing protein [Streptomyces sp. CBMA291]MBD0714474.1 META domain-containing protein [Streptomyces sp. CBMA370]